MQELSEQEIVRREALQKLIDLGIDPYPAAEFPVNITAKEVKEQFAEGKEMKDVVLAGRMMSSRIMGKASFAELQDATGRIQIYIARDEICPGEDKTLYNDVFKKLMDRGDFIGIKGHVFKTQVGETSIYVKELTMLAKSIKPLPVVKTDADGKVHDAVSDAEFRYRQRYVDLVVNPATKEVFKKRTKLYSIFRDYFNEHEILEVETPILQAIPGGAAARPFITHHNALDIPLYMRVANELYLKRLIVGGFDGVYEFAKDFRNEGMDLVYENFSRFKNLIFFMGKTGKKIFEESKNDWDLDLKKDPAELEAQQKRAEEIKEQRTQKMESRRSSLQSMQSHIAGVWTRK